MYIVIVVQLLSCVWLFMTPWTAARKPSLSFIISLSLLKFMSIEWCNTAISFSVNHFSSCPQSFPALGSFPMCLFTSGGQSVGASASASVLPMNIQRCSIDWFDLLVVQGALKVFSSIKSWNHQVFRTKPFLWSNSHIHTWLLEKS